jgi:hypothetical protein
MLTQTVSVWFLVLGILSLNGDQVKESGLLR